MPTVERGTMPTVDDVFAEKGLLSIRLPSFERREGQAKMAAAVADTLAAEAVEDEQGRLQAKILVVEAETGIGKTLAYLIPGDRDRQNPCLSYSRGALRQKGGGLYRHPDPAGSDCR